MNQDILTLPVQFFSGGQPIVGDLFLPAGPAPAGGFPAVICAHGYGGIRKTTTPDTARAYARAGFAAMIFDFRGFGDSGGQRWLLLPRNEVEDTRNAITWLAADARIDASRIAIHGSSFGGAVAVATAAVDDRLRCVICSVGIGNGRRWLQSLRRNHEWLEFCAEVDQDRVERVRTGQSRMVDPYYIMISDPFSVQRHVELNRDFPERIFQLPLESAEAIMDFVPEDEMARATPRPGLILAVAGDSLVSENESRQIYAKWPGPKQLVVLNGFRHHDVYASALVPTMAATLPFLREHLQLAG